MAAARHAALVGALMGQRSWRVLRLTLLCLVVSSGGCGRGCGAGGRSKGTAASSGRGAGQRHGFAPLVVQLHTEPPALLPMIHPDQWAHRIVVHDILETLVRFAPRPPHILGGELAARFRVSPDGKTYDFELRRGVRWHDGKPFSSADVVFTFDRVLDEKVRAVSTRAMIRPFIAGYRAVGAHGFRIVCKRRSPYFLKSLADLTILPAHLMREGDLNRHPLLRRPIGTGPYRFVRWKSGREIEVARNDDYWGRKPKIERIIYRIVRSPELALALAKKGELDFLPRIHGAQWAQSVQKDRALLAAFAPVQHVTPGTAFVLFNHRRKLFADVAVRRALAMLLDVPTIVGKIMHGQAKRIASLYWVDDPEHDDSLKPIAFDPRGAEKLLASAGWRDDDKDGVLERATPEGRGTLKLSFTFLVVASSKSTRRWATIYQQELRKARIAMRVQPIEWTAYLARIRKHDFDIGTLGMALAGPYTDLYLQFHSSQIEDGQNYSAYSNAAVDRLLEQIRGELDDKKRLALSHRLQQLLAREVPVIPLFTLMEPGLVSRRVTGVYRSPLWYQLRDWSLKR